MKFWVFTGKEAIGPFSPAEMSKVPGFGPDTVVAPDGAASAEAWKPSRDYAELRVLFFTPPPAVSLPGPPPPTAPEPPKAGAPARLEGYFCPLCDHRIATDDLCCANCGEMLPKEARDRYLAAAHPEAPPDADSRAFWRKYALYVSLGLAGLAVAGSVAGHLSRRKARRAALERAKREEALPPISVKVDAPAPEAPAPPPRRRKESRATLAERRAKPSTPAPVPAGGPAVKKSATDMSVDELTKYLDRGKRKK